ncbi:MAG: hypothetical protein RIR79_1342 [Pseudomonadota bacterium]
MRMIQILTHYNRPMFLHPYQFHRLVRVVLAWYVLFVGVSLLSSVVQPRTWDSVCSVAGMVSIAEHDDGSQPAKIMAMECSLCAHTTPVLPPLPALPIGWLVNAALAYALLPITEAILIALTAPPLPSRGPPVSI